MLTHTAQKSFMSTCTCCCSCISIRFTWILKLSRNRSCLSWNTRIDKILYLAILVRSMIIIIFYLWVFILSRKWLLLLRNLLSIHCLLLLLLLLLYRSLRLLSTAITTACRLFLQIIIFIRRCEGWFRQSFLEFKRIWFKLLL